VLILCNDLNDNDMKINDRSICTTIVTKEFCDFHISHINKVSKNSIDEDFKVWYEKLNFFQEKGFRILVLSKKSKMNLENYMVPKDIRIDVLKSLPNRKDVIQIDEQNCIKYVKTDTTLSVITCYRKSDEIDGLKNDIQIHTHFFTVDLITGDVLCDQQNTYNREMINDRKILIEKFYSKFLVLVTYLELTNVTFQIVDCPSSKSYRKQSLETINKSRFNVIQVNSNWNTEIINVNTFGVRGHYRLQGCGTGRREYRFVWVNPYEKGLLHRLSQKELVS
jgi:hypothetical protein